MTSENIDFFVFGLKRSGHHAITNWIAKNLKGDVNHYNDCIVINGGKLQPKEGYFESYIYNNKKDNHEIIKRQLVHHPKHCIYSFENFDFELYHPQKIITTTNFARINVLTIRDPFNWIASCFFNKGSIGRQYKNWIDLWIMYAAEFFLDTHYLGHHSYPYRLSFNKWFKSRDYRKSMAKVFNLDSFDRGINDVRYFASGSTFDGMKLNGRAQEMDVLNRFNIHKDNSEYLNILKSKKEFIKYGEALLTKDMLTVKQYKKLEELVKTIKGD